MSIRFRNDLAIIILLLLFNAIFAAKFVNFKTIPFEDAAMFMRYAEHFAQGHGIVWNIGDKPVDGATDFLFVILTGFLVQFGLSLEFATRFIGFASHILTVLIIYFCSRRLHHAPIFPSLIASLYLSVGPGLYYVAAYFGTPCFALFACLTWYAALHLILQKETKYFDMLFALSALITSLIRPEGVILTGLMLLTIIYLNGLQKSRSVMLYYIGTFIFLGGFYFLWRWHYFGYPLPNPFYRKGGWHLYTFSLKNSIIQTIKLCLPFLPAYILGFYTRPTIRLTIGFFIPILGFASAFILISDETNFGARFQYVLLPIVLMSWWPLVKVLGENWFLPKWNNLFFQKRIVIGFLIAVLTGGIIVYQYTIHPPGGTARDGRYDIAIMLSEYKDKGFIIATTEAGLLPLYSRWKALDTWGLNDQWIAHHGIITKEYLDSFKPHIIMFHANFSPLVPPMGAGQWFEMVITLKNYAERKGYLLAAIFGDSPYHAHYYYVRPDFPESATIADRIRSMDYYWFYTGRKAINYSFLAAKESKASIQ